MSGSTEDCRAPTPTDDRPASWPGRTTSLVCRYLLAAVFLAAAITKITDLPAFKNQVLLHSSLPHPVGVAVVVVLPWLELTCGACLALGHAVREAALIAAVLLVLFMVYSLAFRTGADCHCFFLPATFSSGDWWWPLARNLILLVGSLWVIRQRPS